MIVNISKNKKQGYTEVKITDIGDALFSTLSSLVKEHEPRNGVLCYAAWNEGAYIIFRYK